MAVKLQDVKKKIHNVEGIVILQSSDYEMNRYAVENSLVEGLMDVELSAKMDKLHYRTSGLDDVLCKTMAKANICYMINFRTFAKSDRKEIIFGRMLQNVKLCRKYSVSIRITSGALEKIEEKDKSILIAFGEILGADAY